MRIAFDRYERLDDGAYRDLATGMRVAISVREVPDTAWRLRWRTRVSALVDAPAGIQRLIDAGDAGPHTVFEVVEPGRASTAPLGRTDRAHLAVAIEWLDARGLAPGPCDVRRVLAGGRLACDVATGWPVETADEQAEAARQVRQWRARLRGGAAAARRAATGAGGPDVVRGEWAAHARALDELDTRSGLVSLALPLEEALRFARARGLVALASTIAPERLSREALASRSFLVVGEPAAHWAVALAVAGPRRHYDVSTRPRLAVAREAAVPYVSADRGRAAVSTERAARAMTGDAAAVAAEALRCAGRAGEAWRLLDAALQQGMPAFSCLLEAAEASTDLGRLAQGEAFARAALRSASTERTRLRAQIALDRARVWRGGRAEGEPWCARANALTGLAEPRWPARGGYPHAPLGALADWEWRCDRLERALWAGDAGTAARVVESLLRDERRMPPLVAVRTAWLVARATGRSIEDAAVRAHRLGAVGVLRTGKARSDMEMLDAVSSLLTTDHGDDLAAGLTAAAVRARATLGAAAVAVHAAADALPVAGDGHGWRTASSIAARCLAAPHVTGLEREGSWMRAGASIGAPTPVGALVASWPSGLEVDVARVRRLLEAAAVSVAPMLRAWSRPPAAGGDMPEMVGVSAAMAAVRDAVRRVARVPFPVLVSGESGVGKELVARAIHRLSPRGSRPFKAINCAAMADDLVEAELFGRAQGAYTGATTARAGLFEAADGGTLFLDEVSELSPRAQAKLLRVLQDGEVRRVGEASARRADTRVIAAANVALTDAVAARAFRADLLFRLDVLGVTVPPLRERPEDIPLLAMHFWREAASRAGTSAVLAPDVVGRLSAYGWPGNIRELQNIIVGLAVAAPRRGRVTTAALPPHLREPATASAPRTLHEARLALEREMVRGALARAGGRSGRAAAELGLSRQGLAKLIRRLGLSA